MMNGRNIIPAPKNRMNARVKGGIPSRANLKTGGAAPQTRTDMMTAIIPDMLFFLFIQVNNQLANKPGHDDLNS
jgi:hypothetical protein